MKKQRKGSWMTTKTGIHFYPMDPRPSEICLEDIAHALANICRFGGHTRMFYSVAQHCVMVSRHVEILGGDVEAQMWGLLHDASEAYIGDMVRPLKDNQPSFKEVEKAIHVCVKKAFGIRPLKRAEDLVHRADNVVLVTEARDFMGNPEWIKHFSEPPLPAPILPLSHYQSRGAFIARFVELRKKMSNYRGLLNAAA